MDIERQSKKIKIKKIITYLTRRGKQQQRRFNYLDFIFNTKTKIQAIHHLM